MRKVLIGLGLAGLFLVACGEKKESNSQNTTAPQTTSQPTKNPYQGEPPAKVAKELNKEGNAFNYKAGTCGNNCLKITITPSFTMTGEPYAAGIAPYVYYAVEHLCKSGLAPFANVELAINYKTQEGIHELLSMKGLKTDFCSHYRNIEDPNTMDIIKGYKLLNAFSDSAIKIEVKDEQALKEICKGMEKLIGQFCSHLGF
jgi:hypothetical protein